MSDIRWLPFEPSFPDGSDGPALLADFASVLMDLPSSEDEKERNGAVEVSRQGALKARNKCDPGGRQHLVAAVNVLADLARQGWKVRLADSTIEIGRNDNGEANAEEVRERVRAQLHAERDQQIRQPAAASFIRSMEAKRLFEGQFVSIFSLMRNGVELAARLGEVRAADEADQLSRACEVIRPYLQFVRNEGDRCALTGLRLTDIWRYFRHTWANPYKSVPGRSIMVLVRDTAAPFHPVMGIAALSSATVAVTARDEKIGWTPRRVIQDLKAWPSAKLAIWLQETVDQAIDEIYKVDFFEDDVLTPRGLKHPMPGTVKALDTESRQQRKEHYRFMEAGAYKKAEPAGDLGENHWEGQARNALFRSKRALALANLLSVRMVLQRFFKPAPSKASLTKLLEDRAGREAVSKIVRKAKADRVGTAIADLTVCGALPPYNEVLGGKLVAMLLISPEMLTQYRKRYKGAPSVIASSMAGRPICRPADLVFIGTTSLYGQRPSQYDRIVVPSDLEVPTGPGLRYEYLGKTRGLGTFQFGDQTVSDLALMLSQSKRGQQVNSVFGEGVNPRLRKIRDGLDRLGLPTDDLLNHGGSRLVYGVKLTENTHAYLLGQDNRPKYILSQKGAAKTTEQIARWWVSRWLLSRIARDDVLERVRRHTCILPVRHGARVEMPFAEIEDGNVPQFAPPRVES